MEDVARDRNLAGAEAGAGAGGGAGARAGNEDGGCVYVNACVFLCVCECAGTHAHLCVCL